MTDVDENDVTHALLLRADESEMATRSATFVLERDRGTALRGAVALATEDGSIIGLGAITEMISPPAAGDTNLHRWRLEGVRPLTSPLRVRPRAFGPVWLRLDGSERRRLSGEASSGPSPAISTASLTVNQPSQALATTLPPLKSLAPGPEAPASIEDDFAPARATHPPALADARRPEDLDMIATPEPPTDDDASEGPPTSPPPPASSAPEAEVAEIEAGDVALAPDHAAAHEGDLSDLDLDAERPAADLAGATAVPSIADHAARIAAARARAMGYVPAETLNEDAARALLIRLREEEIKATFPHTAPAAGVLRKSLLERLIDEAVESEADFDRLLPREVRAATDRDQIDAYLAPIVAILARIR